MRRTLRPCKHLGCPKLTAATMCDEHAKAVPKPKAWSSTTTSAHDRGYGARWRELRRVVLSRDPSCMLCQAQPSTQVDHLVAKAHGGTDDMTNLRGVCKPCHARKTAQDSASGARLRGPTRRSSHWSPRSK
jgi:5-methylcytosine-specific restriction enzyme A